MVAWQAFLDKRQKVDAAEEAESKKKMESVSEAPVYLAFGLTKAHQGALENDSYVQQMKAKGVIEGPQLYAKYPPPTRVTLRTVTGSSPLSPTVRASEHEPHETGRENVADAGRLVECLRRQAERVRHSKCPLRHAGL